MNISDMSIKEKTKEDFDRAYFEAMISRIFDRFQGEKDSLLSFSEIMKFVKIKNQSYKGMQFVLIDDIVGSEGRYNDFNKKFLPKRRILRERWQRVDEAHYKDVILPPIQLYQLGKAYFVRDGNHRVSVAKRQGMEFIDAEVTEIYTDIEINPDMTKEDLVKILIENERKNFLEMTNLSELRDVSMINFTTTGLFDTLLTHINGHQYFLGIDKKESVSFDEALLSWYDNLFLPIIKEIEEDRILFYFPGRTEADLYVWIIRHWDELKNKFGQKIKISDAVKSFKNNYGGSTFGSFFKWLSKLLK
ncbi:MAG: hypothetical protein A2086_12000 [Spirochaetes bacterium GWD1_27_9]|nr:MAG: hypothetical protein A2Z98_06880 [Spirochaetes bacterium GWB1_27_13]OHD22118.1 MAG: hypothetical protein A2Y34_13470 [Spirochaetes bacterium GWC1_27_15]OHD28991.1 MAG: hypothetical protein A2086_12000 [Spirochaetes bacterium GWD1_27_9]